MNCPNGNVQVTTLFDSLGQAMPREEENSIKNGQVQKSSKSIKRMYGMAKGILGSPWLVGGGDKHFSPPKDSDTQSGNRSSCAGTMSLPSRNTHIPLARILL